MQIQIPPQVETVLQKLTASGFEAYVVGGCVRDSILGLEPNDWDVTTSAPPEETERIFSGYPCVKTGIQHGTLTVLIDHRPVEVTTFRVDGQYSDNRHPDSVRFTRSLKDDLSRRDFTVNALAYSHADGVIDCFGGMDDLKDRIIRCVGTPGLRFQEDGLRILRALRFSSVLGFSPEPNTSAAILSNCGLLQQIARERIQSELTRLLCGNPSEVLRKYRTVLEQIIPEFSSVTNVNEWEYTLKAVSMVEATPVLRLTMLLYHIRQSAPSEQNRNEKESFDGSCSQNAEAVKAILLRLRYDSDTVKTVSELTGLQRLPLPADERSLLKLLHQYDKKIMDLLFKVRDADLRAQNPPDTYGLEELKKAEAIFQSIFTRKLCYSLKDLQIKGSDLLSIGIPEGTEIGRMLSQLLSAVMDGKCLNRREALLKYALQLKEEYHDGNS